MSPDTAHDDIPPGHALFARYAYPPNELGYCGPVNPDARGPSGLAGHAVEFDGAWPYLRAIADAAGLDDPLDAEVVRAYWVGGALLADVNPRELLQRLRTAFHRQTTGMLTAPLDPAGVLAHHSFHVFAVYPWIRLLDRDPATPLRVMQNCRIRWGTVVSVTDEHVLMLSRPLTFTDGDLRLGAPAPEHVRWHRDGVSLVARPVPGEAVSAHWDWVCGTLDDTECAALDTATARTLELVAAARAHHTSRGTSKSAQSARHTSRGSTPASMASAAVRPIPLNTWSTSTEAP
ncbi:hypothetical protein FHU31_002561 [Mycolicibacterium fluoranthenivorans]|uniref:Uncharacterized protein n=1 Tax=Mycolicibacterium fluoranthenivorans TaxID=258505 RepID=A0A7X5ZD20_9MYCO|nr:hypothetical protein [Mycolicibacterium fluoranthenivorans]